MFETGFDYTSFEAGAVLMAVFAGNLFMKPMTTPVPRVGASWIKSLGERRGGIERVVTTLVFSGDPLSVQAAHGLALAAHGLALYDSREGW
jgi:hypothetical protein